MTVSKAFEVNSRSRLNLKHSVLKSWSKGWLCDCEWFAMKGTQCFHIRTAQVQEMSPYITLLMGAIK